MNNRFNQNFDLSDDLEDFNNSNLPRIKITNDKTKNKKKAKKVKKINAAMTSQADDHNSFQFTYKASRYEAPWIKASLGKFHEQQWFDDVLRLIRGGKEASVYLCKGNQSSKQDYLAAKVYRPRRFRNLRKDHLYREGRERLDESGNVITNDGMLYAMKKKSTYGLQLMHQSWISHEFETMKILHAAGADIPTPYACDHNAILMDYFGAEGMPAPTLNEVDLSISEAEQLFKRVIENVEIMLANRIVHGDLSAYNILYWEGDLCLIDFPQAISPDQNHNAYRIFTRDITRICDYFTHQGVNCQAVELSQKLWQANAFQFFTPVHPAHLDGDSQDDKDYWNNIRQ
ncbi:MAG: hypothetical protein JEZ06_10240 [Anaerolineaceae bacterium]|nr:hypothetical protein [Anaerolineaceae bacterium]